MGLNSNDKMLSAKVKAIKAPIPVESTLDPNLMDLSYDPNSIAKGIS